MYLSELTTYAKKKLKAILAERGISKVIEFKQESQKSLYSFSLESLADVTAAVQTKKHMKLWLFNTLSVEIQSHIANLKPEVKLNDDFWISTRVSFDFRHQWDLLFEKFWIKFIKFHMYLKN